MSFLANMYNLRWFVSILPLIWRWKDKVEELVVGFGEDTFTDRQRIGDREL